MKKKQDRKIFRVLPVEGEWIVRFELDEEYVDKRTAIFWAKRYAKEHRGGGGLSQVVVHDKKGKIQTEYTYGKDPKRRKG